MTAVLLTQPKIRFFDNNGDPLSGGKIHTYAAGGVTPKATYTDSTMATPNANPVILDSAGYANIWISGSYRIVVEDSAGVQITDTDNITSFTAGTTNATFSDASFTLQDDADPTKQVVFQLSGIGTGTTVTLTAPTGNGTLARTSDVIGIVGSARNARMSVTSAAATATFTADEIVVETALGSDVKKLANFSQAVNLASNGAGGMDTGSAPTNGFVSLYAIAKADGTTSILACNVTTSSGSIYAGANMPTGYTYSALISTWPTDGSSRFKVGFQMDRMLWFAKTNVLSTASPATSYTAISLTSVVPTNAKLVYGTAGAQSNVNCVFGIAADTSGTALQVISLPTTTISGATVGGYGVGAPAEQWGPIPLITAQNIYYISANSGFSVNIDVTAYSI